MAQIQMKNSRLLTVSSPLQLLCIFAIGIHVLSGSGYAIKVADERVTIKGKVVDDQTGKPVTQMMIQAGKIDPKDPKKITWGYSERNTKSKTGQFSTTVRWSEGWTARIVADGYEPHPIISKSPQLGQKEISVEIRLKRGKPILGKIVDHAGKPVSGAKVFSISPRGLNLYGGNAHSRYDDAIDSRAKFVTSKADGSFELPSGGADRVAVSSESLDAWVAKVDSKITNTIQLPAPTSVRLTYDVKNNEKEAEVFYQLLTYLMDDFEKVHSTRKFKIKNGETLEMKSFPPGKYQFCRNKMHSFESIGMSAMIDRVFVEIKAGETTEINFSRPKGKSVAGIVRWSAEDELAGIIINIKSIEQVPDPWDQHKMEVTYDSQLLAGKPQQKIIPSTESAFKTEPLAPGKYKLQIVAYKAMTQAEMRSTGFRRPDFDITKEIEVTEKGAPNMLVIDLVKAQK